MEHANETPTMLIGSNTVNGNRNKRGTSAKQKKRPLPKSKEYLQVEVSANGTVVRQMPLQVLTRFSKVAAAAFPRPEPSEKPANVGAAQSSKKKLDLHLNTFKFQPPEDAFDLAFDWMDNAKLTPRGNPTPDYGGPQPESRSLEEQVNIYAAAVALGIRPAPHKLRQTLLSCITEERPTRATLKYVHEHLPIDDAVMTRFITSYFEHRETHKHPSAEEEEIVYYVCNVHEKLYDRFKEIEESRGSRGKARRRPPRRIAEGRMQEIARVETGGIQLVDAESRVARGLTAGGRSRGRGRRR